MSFKRNQSSVVCVVENSEVREILFLMMENRKIQFDRMFFGLVPETNSLPFEGAGAAVVEEIPLRKVKKRFVFVYIFFFYLFFKN